MYLGFRNELFIFYKCLFNYVPDSNIIKLRRTESNFRGNIKKILFFFVYHNDLKSVIVASTWTLTRASVGDKLWRTGQIWPTV